MSLSGTSDGSAGGNAGTPMSSPRSSGVQQPARQAPIKVRVWDLPTRLFHWLLAVSVLASVITAHIGGNAMVWHFRLGQFALALLVFRLVWGVVGGRWSRFSSFIYAPARMLRYLRGQARPGDHFEVGHSPLGSLSVFAFLALLCLQVGTGLLADDELGNVGPLNRFVSSRSASLASGWHSQVGQWLLIALMTLHVGAIAYYALRKKRDLIGPMVSGDKAFDAPVPPSTDSTATRALAVLIAVGCGALSLWIASLS